mgnify:CR=1 FL=1
MKIEKDDRLKMNANGIPTCRILGVEIAAINMSWLIEYTKNNIKKLSGNYMCVSNVHTTVTAYNDSKYRDIQNGGIMAIPDGKPLSIVGKSRGFHDMERTTGPDYMMEMLKCSAEFGYRHYFYGSTEETLEKLRARMEEEFPNVNVAGTYSPPFRTLSEKEKCDIIREINSANADFIWVGLGAPKQEIWMAEHQGKVNGFMVGVGAAFDYFAGNIQRAPEWMQKMSLEWLYRLLQDPKRLFKRYLQTNMAFIWHVLREKK